MASSYFAHSGNPNSDADWQLLRDHLLGVSNRAAEMGTKVGLGAACHVAGLFHDLGKYSADFQRRLRGEDLSVDHSTAGARVLFERSRGADQAIAQIVAYAILGHHAGLPDMSNATAGCYEQRMKRELPALDPVWEKELGGVPSGFAPPMFAGLAGLREDAAFALAFMGRMIFSCLVDADFKDTEAFYVSLGTVGADRDWPPLQSPLAELTSRFDRHMAALGGRGGVLSDLRGDILAHVRARASDDPGIFTLTVPTGGGKTLASLGFALNHARRHGLERIIYAIPFTSVIDQTAAVFRSVLGEEHVLEHHSAIDETRTVSRGGEGGRERRDKLKLAMEDWAAPIVVTTNVQLFESLFSARPSRSRKLHNIANSVIVLDEAQMLPRNLLLPTLRAIEELTARYGCSVVLCTATQPALGRRAEFPRGLLLRDDAELAPDPAGLSARLARTHIRHAGDMDNAALIEALRDRPQGLMVVNSRRHALDLFKEARAEELDGLIHLTTRQYAAHRRRILDDVRERLKDGRPCRLIATSLIEAGVDVDFPVAFRAEGGLDQIIQVAGRVNREGRRPRDESIVTVFNPPDYSPPPEIKGLIGDMKRIIARHPDLTSLAAVEDYFGEVYWRMGDKLDAKGILGRFLLSKSGTDFSYRRVGEDYRMIESGMEPVIVAIEPEALEAVNQLGIAEIPSGLLARKLQSFTVQIPPKARARIIECGHAAFMRPDLRGDQFAVLTTKSLYRDGIGLVWEDADYLSVEASIL